MNIVSAKIHFNVEPEMAISSNEKSLPVEELEHLLSHKTLDRLFVLLIRESRVRIELKWGKMLTNDWPSLRCMHERELTTGTIKAILLYSEVAA